MPVRKFCISDIHGCADTFRALLDAIALEKADHLFLLGDYVNRGPDSRGVLDTIMRLQSDGYTVFVIRGNHDQMFLDARSDVRAEMMIMQNGGEHTMASFGVTRMAEIPDAYFEFVSRSSYFMEVGPWLLVHAGFNFKNAQDYRIDTNAMLWMRNFKPRRRQLKGRHIVHGHNPWPRSRIEAQLAGKRPEPVINIDCGCVYNEPESALCALELTEMRMTFVENCEPGYRL
jgi:serine/threonine protein phosphatase 1